MRVLVCGGRRFREEEAVRTALDAIHALSPISLIIEGGAPGADRACAAWARARGITVMTFTADWDALGRAAGPIRNALMLAEGRPQLVVAFPGGRGTAHMKRLATEALVPVIEPLEPDEPLPSPRPAGRSRTEEAGGGYRLGACGFVMRAAITGSRVLARFARAGLG